MFRAGEASSELVGVGSESKSHQKTWIIFLTFCVHTHNDEQDLSHGAIGLQMDSGFWEPVYAL